MQRLPAVVVPLFQSDATFRELHAVAFRWLVFWTLSCWSLQYSDCLADSPVRAAIDENGSPTRYIAHIQLHSASELDNILRRADDLYQHKSLATNEPVVFVLHGAEARVFLRSRYTEHKALVDRAARLTAFDVVDIRVCERWMGGQGIVPEQLVPFVSTVEYGPAEINRLRQRLNYIDF